MLGLPRTAIIIAVVVLHLHASAEEREFVLSTGAIARHLHLSNGQLFTRKFVNDVTKRTWECVNPSPEFRLLVGPGTLLASKDYRAKPMEIDHSRLTFQLTPIRPEHPSLVIEYLAKPGEHFLRKRVIVEGTTRIDSIDVECLSATHLCSHGGMGQPLVVDDEWFAGLEYPAGYASREGGFAVLRHHPAKEKFASKWSVIGGRTVSRESVKSAFFKYLDTIRRPSRAVLVYNTWFHARGDEVSEENIASAFKELKSRILDPHQVKLDAFVLDDGYQDPRSLWAPSHCWPRGFDGFSRKLRQSDTSLGLWLPLNGSHLDTSWGDSQGYRTAQGKRACYSLCDPNYKEAITKVIKDHADKVGVTSFKHDFNDFDVPMPVESFKLSREATREANLDAQLDILNEIHQAFPHVYQCVTSGTWLSPWWLGHADAIWMGGSDYRRDWTVPQWTSRQAELNYRDTQLYRSLVQDDLWFPASALMTHGLMLGRHDDSNPATEIEEWQDYVAIYFARGTQYQEMYLSTEQMTDSQCEVVGRIANWARSEQETLRNSTMIGGNPAHSEVYGFIHHGQDRGILTLRNPATLPAKFLLTAQMFEKDSSSDRDWSIRTIYPFARPLGVVPAKGSIEINIPSSSVTIIEWRTSVSSETEDPAERTKDEMTWSNEGMTVDEKNRWSRRFVIDGNGEDLRLTVIMRPAFGARLRVQGEWELSRTVSRPDGDDWSLHEFRAKPRQPKALVTELEVTLPISPFWPERVDWNATLSSRFSNAESDRESLLPSSPSTRHEAILVDRDVLERRRSWIERVGWFFFLGVLPIVGVHVLVSRAVARLSVILRAIARLIGILALLALYFMSPLGSALGRCFFSS